MYSLTPIVQISCQSINNWQDVNLCPGGNTVDEDSQSAPPGVQVASGYTLGGQNLEKQAAKVLISRIQYNLFIVHS